MRTLRPPSCCPCPQAGSLGLCWVGGPPCLGKARGPGHPGLRQTVSPPGDGETLVCRAHLPAWALPAPAPPCPRNSQFQSLLCPRWGLGTPIAPEKAPPGPSSVGRGARGWALPRGAGLQGPRGDGCLQELGRSRQAATTFSPRLPPETRPSTGRGPCRVGGHGKKDQAVKGEALRPLSVQDWGYWRVLVGLDCLELCGRAHGARSCPALPWQVACTAFRPSGGGGGAQVVGEGP